MDIKLLTTTACLLLFQGAWAAEQYVDVHVHIRGATRSGMLGYGRKGGERPPRPGVGPRAPAGSQEEHWKNAAANLIKKMDKHGVQHALVVIVPGPQSHEAEYQSMRKIVAKHPDRLKLMAGGAQLSPYLQKMPPDKVTAADNERFRRIATQLLKNGAVGFGEMISYHLSMADHHSFQYAPADHPHFLVLADIAAGHNVAIDLHMEAIVKGRPTPANLRRASTKNPATLTPTIPAFERLLAHNRKARIVWQHIGWDNVGDMTPDLIGRLLGAHPNLYIALRVERRIMQVGGGPVMPNRLVDRQGTLKPEWLAVIKKFSDRITLGSDEFFFPIESTRPNQSFEGTWSILKQLPNELAQKLGRDNPRRIYNLK